MGLFSTQRGGVPMSNAYQFEGAVQPADPTLLFQGLAAGRRGSGATRGASAGKDDTPKGLVGAKSEYLTEKFILERDKDAFLSKAVRMYNESGENDMLSFMQANQEAFAKDIATFNQREIQLQVAVDQMERDSKRYDEAYSDPNITNNIVLETVGNGQFIGYGRLRDGSFGYDYVQNLRELMDGSNALPRINANSTMFGTQIPNAYDPQAGINELRTYLNDKTNTTISFEGGAGQSFRSNYNAIDSFISSGIAALSSEGWKSLYNEALLQSTKVPIFHPDDENKEMKDKRIIDYEYILPVLTPQEQYFEVKGAKPGEGSVEVRWVMAPVVGADGNQLTINAKERPDLAMHAIAQQIGGAMAAGREKIEISERIVGAGMGREEKRIGAYYSRIANAGPDVIGDPVVVGFGSGLTNIRENMDRIQASVSSDAKKAQTSILWNNWMQNEDNKRRWESPNEAVFQSAIRDVNEYIKRQLDASNPGRPLGYGNFARTVDPSNPNNFITRNLGDNNISAWTNYLVRKGKSFFTQKGIDAVEATEKLPEEILFDATFGEEVIRERIPGTDVRPQTQSYFQGAYEGEIRIAGSATTSTYQLKGDKPGDGIVPMEVAYHAQTPSYYMINGRMERHPSLEVFFYLTEKEFNNMQIYTHRRNGRIPVSAKEFKDFYETVNIDEIGSFAEKQLNDQIRAVAAATGEKVFYKVPGQIAITNPPLIDSYINEVRAYGDATKHEALNYFDLKLIEAANAANSIEAARINRKNTNDQQEQQQQQLQQLQQQKQ